MNRNRKKILNPITMLLAGLFLGVASRLFDIYFDNLGNIFSQMAVWILLGALIAIYSSTKKPPCLTFFLFASVCLLHIMRLLSSPGEFTA